MSYRCTDPFIFADQVFPGGLQVDDDNPILKTHSAFFAKVDVPPAVRTETASAAPGEVRVTAPAKKAPAKKAAPKTEPKTEPKDDN